MDVTSTWKFSGISTTMSKAMFSISRNMGLRRTNVAQVFDNPVGFDTSDSSGRPMVFGYADEGRYIVVVYEQIDDDMVYPVTAFEVPEMS